MSYWLILSEPAGSLTRAHEQRMEKKERGRDREAKRDDELLDLCPFFFFSFPIRVCAPHVFVT